MQAMRVVRTKLLCGAPMISSVAIAVPFVAAAAVPELGQSGGRY
jgi:hypothetical protein